MPPNGGSAPAEQVAAPPVTLAGIEFGPGRLAVFETCFRKFKVSVELKYLTAAEIDSAQFDGCVLALDARAPELLRRIRDSRLSPRTLVYGIGSPDAVIAVAHLGVNAVLPSLAEVEVSKAVESTYLLLVRKLRRFVRVPIVTPVQVQGGADVKFGVSRDLSAGGMAVSVAAPAEMPSRVTVSFVLPSLPPLSLPALVCWRTADAVGLQFAGSEDEIRLKGWVDQYLNVA